MDSLKVFVSSLSVSDFIRGLQEILRSHITNKLIFEDKELRVYQNKGFFQLITARYKESIDDANKKLGFTISFTLIAIYVYFVLPETEAVSIPILELSASRQIRISVAPAISLVLEILVITSLLWFSVLRSGIQTLIAYSKYSNLAIFLNTTKSKRKSKKNVPNTDSEEALIDPTSLLMKGILGDFWMVLSLRKAFNSRLNYIWYIPLILLAFSILLSPTIIAIFFTSQLYITYNANIGIAYMIIFLPVSILLLILIVMVGALSSTEESSII